MGGDHPRRRWSASRSGWPCCRSCTLAPLHPLLIAFYAVAASLMLSLLGFLGGLWADKFDQMAAVTNFVITPLSFLSGTFYSDRGAARVLALDRRTSTRSST